MTTGAPPPSQSPPGGAVPGAPKPADPARSGAIMLLVAAALLLVGTISKSWVTAGDSEDRIHAGPMGAEVCMESVCVDVPFRGIDKDIEIFAMLAMLGGFASAAVAGAFGGMVLAGSRQVPVPTKLANTVFAIALLAMLGFLVRMLSEKANISWAGFVAMGGVLVGIVGLSSVKPFLTARALPAGTVQPHAQYGSQPYQQGNPYANQPYANQSQPQQPYANQSQPHANQSQPQQPYANQSQPQQPYANESQPQQPYANQSQPYQQPMQPQAQHGSQPYQQPMQPQAQHGSQPHQQPMQAHPQYGSQPHHMAPQQPPPQQALPHCPRCGTQLQFVAQYQRWFCPREQQYV